MKRMCLVFGMICLMGAVWPSSGHAQSVLLDGNLAVGYQGLDGLVDVKAGQRVALEVYGKDVTGVSGFSVVVTYAATQLRFDGFTAGSLIPGFTGLNITQSAGQLEIGGASVEGTSKVSQGRLGVIYFQTLEGFTGSATVALSQGRIVKGTASASINTQAQVVVGLVVKGPVMIDGDAAPGLQAARRVVDVKVGDVISVEVYGRGISGASGFSAILSYDKAQLSFEGFDATQIIPGFTGLRLVAGGTVEIGGASVTGTSRSAEGRLGVLRFKVLRGFTGTTSIELVGGRLTLGTEISNYTSDLILSISGIAGGGPLVKTPDFNGNGVVDFPDFLMFATGFGKKLGDVGYLEALDLNDNGTIDFPDFLVFAQQFGKSVGK
jgi:hypothetical protein